MQILCTESLKVSSPINQASSQLAVRWWVAFSFLLIANLPLMICMPLTADPVLYDLQAQTTLKGGVLYRDIVEPNLPGIVWIHLAVRSILGWSTYALRSFDLLVFAGIVVLLLGIAKEGSLTRDFRVRIPVLTLLLCWFYFSLPELAHCQRDIWLMLPALAALWLRIRQLHRSSPREVENKTFLLSGGLEGILWGIAFWIKPFVIVPALAGLLISAFLIRNPRGLVLNFGTILLGGILCGVCGSIWLIETGAWPHFWDMAFNWNPEYFEMGRANWRLKLYTSLMKRLMPWVLIHLVAIPIAVRNLVRLIRSSKNKTTSPALCLLSAIYLGWVIQSHTLQHLFDYAHVPGILLGLTLLVSSWPSQRVEVPIANAAFASLVIMAILISPATDPNRLRWWGRCITEGSSPEVRCGLQHMPLPDWKQLQPVVDFLKAQKLEDRNITAYNTFLIHLYPELGMKPSTRYVYLDVHTRIFRSRTAQIEKTLNDSPQVFVVSSLLEDGMRLDDIGPFSPRLSPELPSRFPVKEKRYFPYNQKLIFRSGQYVVHRITKPVGPLNTNLFPLDHTTISSALEAPRAFTTTE